MNVIDVHVKDVTIEVDGTKVQLYSHDSIAEPETHLLHVMMGGSNLVFAGPTRGHALLEAAEFFRALGPALSRLAFEQEGAVRVPNRREVNHDRH
jgi:hypothetical protein